MLLPYVPVQRHVLEGGFVRTLDGVLAGTHPALRVRVVGGAEYGVRL